MRPPSIPFSCLPMLLLLMLLVSAVLANSVPVDVIEFQGRRYEVRSLPRLENDAQRRLQSRIVGGYVAPAGQRHFQAILWKYAVDEFGNIVTDSNGTPYISFACGGSLITNTDVLTAAHCLPDVIAVEVGDDTPFELPYTGDYVTVTSEIPHPQYNDVTSENDVAILRLSGPITSFPKIDLIFQDSAFNFLDDTGEPLRVTGWGATSSGGPTSNVLREVVVPVISNTFCSSGSSYGNSFKPASMICCGSTSGGTDSCQGDSGGPLFGFVGGDPVQVGVVSWGIGCAAPNYPGVYARLTTYETWLRSTVPTLPAASTPAPVPSPVPPVPSPIAPPPVPVPATPAPVPSPVVPPPVPSPVAGPPPVNSPMPPVISPSTLAPGPAPTAAASTDNSMVLIIGAGGGGLIFLAAVAAALVTVARKRRNQRLLANAGMLHTRGEGPVALYAGGKHTMVATNPQYAQW